MFGNRGLQVRTLFQYVGPFCLLWMLTNYSYVRALGVIRAADVTALFSSCNAFVYIFSLIWLQEKLGIVKVRVKCLREPSLFMPGEGEGRAGKIHDKTVKKVLTPPPPLPTSPMPVSFFSNPLLDFSPPQRSFLLPPQLA